MSILVLINQKLNAMRLFRVSTPVLHYLSTFAAVAQDRHPPQLPVGMGEEGEKGISGRSGSG